MYTIGQFSRLCHLTSKALRYYEKIGLLSPTIVDQENQYRYYSQNQIEQAQKIVFLKELGFPLATMKSILSQTNGDIEDLLEEHRQLLLEQLDECNRRLLRLAWWRNTLEVHTMESQVFYDVRLRDVPETMLYSRREQMTDLPKQLPILLRSLLGELESRGAVCAGAPVMLYYDEEFNPDRVDVEAGWPVTDAKLATATLPLTRAVSCTHTGPYEGLEKAYRAVFAWINENGYRAVFPAREVSVNDPQVTPPEQLLTEIIIPVIKK